MLLWTLALLLVLGCGVVGWYVGAVRCAITSVGLILALFLLKPLSDLTAKILPSVGLAHPFIIALLAPVVVSVVIQIIAKSVAHATKAPMENFFKYKATDTQRLLFERMNQRVGPCVGVLNGTLYVVFLGIGAAGLGYGTVAFSRGAQDTWWQKGVNSLALSCKATGWSKVVAPYIPSKPIYYDTVDLAAEWFHQPLVQSALATYPPLIPMAERSDIQTLASDVQAQQFIMGSPTLSDIMSHARLGPIVTSPSFLNQALELLGNDLTDIQTYVRDQKSPKYDAEKILGRWDLNMFGTINENKRARRMTGIEVNRMRALISSQIEGAMMLATIDKKLIVRRPAADGSMTRREGSWEAVEGGGYKLSLPTSDDKALDLVVGIEGKKLTSKILNYLIVFDRW
ncbi:MAG: hypothetical protein FJ405_14795 [Verrucomicrobia bacterium]|nr:hypothetical protein [Verrucomicrobiota bacterium]